MTTEKTNGLDLGKGVRILTYIYKSNGSTIMYMSFELRISYSYLSKVLDQFDGEGFIKKVKDGRAKKIFLTPKGEQIAKRFFEINKILEKK